MLQQDACVIIRMSGSEQDLRYYINNPEKSES